MMCVYASHDVFIYLMPVYTVYMCTKIIEVCDRISNKTFSFLWVIVACASDHHLNANVSLVKCIFIF